MLKIENIKKSYKGFQLDLSMEIENGSIVGLVGANGAGKSTLFKTILGIVHKESGKIYLNDKDITNLRTKDKELISVSMAEGFFPEAFNAKDIKATLKAMYKSFKSDWFDEKCRDFGLDMSKRMSDYSTGMKAKMKVIAALSHDSKLLILDEPTQGLDVVTREEISEMIRGYIDEDEERMVIISSHISSDIEKICDRIYMIDKGKEIINADTDVLISEYAIIRASEEEYKELDKNYILATKKDKYSYNCLTDKKNFYLENYPKLIIEKTTLDEMLIMMIKGDK